MQTTSPHTLSRRASLWRSWLRVSNGPIIAFATYIAIWFLVLCFFLSLFCFFLVISALDDLVSKAAPKQLWQTTQTKHRLFVEKMNVHLEDLRASKSIRAFVATMTGSISDYMHSSMEQ